MWKLLAAAEAGMWHTPMCWRLCWQRHLTYCKQNCPWDGDLGNFCQCFFFCFVLMYCRFFLLTSDKAAAKVSCSVGRGTGRRTIPLRWRDYRAKDNAAMMREYRAKDNAAKMRLSPSKGSALCKSWDCSYSSTKHMQMDIPSTSDKILGQSLESFDQTGMVGGRYSRVPRLLRFTNYLRRFSGRVPWQQGYVHRSKGES